MSTRCSLMFSSWTHWLHPAALIIGSLIISSKYYQRDLISTFHGKMIRTRCYAFCGFSCITQRLRSVPTFSSTCHYHAMVLLFCWSKWQKWRIKRLHATGTELELDLIDASWERLVKRGHNNGVVILCS